MFQCNYSTFMEDDIYNDEILNLLFLDSFKDSNDYVDYSTFMEDDIYNDEILNLLFLDSFKDNVDYSEYATFMNNKNINVIKNHIFEMHNIIYQEIKNNETSDYSIFLNYENSNNTNTLDDDKNHIVEMHNMVYKVINSNYYANLKNSSLLTKLKNEIDIYHINQIPFE